MLAPCAVLLALALLPAHLAEADVATAAGMLAPHLSGAGLERAALDSSSTVPAWSAVSLALSIAGFHLYRDCLPRLVVGGVDRVAKPLFKVLKLPHSGLVGDYVMLIVAGLAAFSVALAFQ